jgi:hypothetical protein
VSDEQRNENQTDADEDVEAHKLAGKHVAGRHEAGESDEGGDDVEAHKMATKIAPKVEP